MAGKLKNLQAVAWSIENFGDDLKEVAVLKMPPIFQQIINDITRRKGDAPPISSLHDTLAAASHSILAFAPEVFNSREANPAWLYTTMDCRPDTGRLKTLFNKWLESQGISKRVSQKDEVNFIWGELELKQSDYQLQRLILPNLVARWLIKQGYQLPLQDKLYSMRFVPLMSRRYVAELISEPEEHDGELYSLVMWFWLSPVPYENSPYLMHKTGMRRWANEEVKIYGKRSKSLYLRRSAGYLENAPRDDVFTRITVRGEWGKVDYLGKQANFLDLLHFEGELPPIVDFLKDPTSFQSHALMPLENRESKNRKVQAGLESSDHRQIFESLSAQFAAFAKPMPILSRVMAGERKRGIKKLQAEDKQAAFLAMPSSEIHIHSSKHFASLEKHILKTIGFSETPANLRILPINDMLLTDSLSGDYKHEERISYIKQKYPQAKVPTGILVELMDYRKTKLQKRDPKKAIRDGLMARGCLSQFFTPKTPDDKGFEHRLKNGVADLLRMMGYRHQPFYRYEPSRQLPQNLDILAFLLFQLNKRNSSESTILLPVVAEVPFGHPHLRLILPSASGRSESYDSIYEGIKAISDWSVDFADNDSIIRFFQAAIEERSSRNPSLLLLLDANLRRIFHELNDSSHDCLSLYGILDANPEIRLARLRFSEDYDAPFCIPPEAKSKYQGLYSVNANAGVYYSLQNVGNRHIKSNQRKLDNPENASTNPSTVLIQLCNLQEADIPPEWAGLVHRLRLESSHTAIATKLAQPLHDIEAIKKFIPRYQEELIDEDLNALGEEEE